MGRDEKRRQKSIMKKRAKDGLRRKKADSLGALARHFSAEGIVLAAGKYPVYECLINPSWKDQGLAHILLSRRQPDGAFVFGVYLVDIFCLGLKNTFCNANFSSLGYSEAKARLFEDTGFVVCPLPLARRIVHGAIEYAARLGFKPQKDFEMSQHVLGREDRTEPGLVTEVVFGKDGRPFYISGPDDDVELILRKLDAKVGPGNYDFLDLQE